MYREKSFECKMWKSSHFWDFSEHNRSERHEYDFNIVSGTLMLAVYCILEFILNCERWTTMHRMVYAFKFWIAFEEIRIGHLCKCITIPAIRKPYYTHRANCTEHWMDFHFTIVTLCTWIEYINIHGLFESGLPMQKHSFNT